MYVFVTLGHLLGAAVIAPLTVGTFLAADYLQNLLPNSYWLVGVMLEAPGNVVIGYLVVFQYCLFRYKQWSDRNEAEPFSPDAFYPRPLPAN